MPTDTLDAAVRRIVREELAAILAPQPSVDATDPPVDVGRFLATLAPAERVAASELYLRWQVWAASGGSPCRLTATAFGRLAMGSGLVRRDGVGRRFYTAAPAGP